MDVPSIFFVNFLDINFICTINAYSSNIGRYVYASTYDSITGNSSKSFSIIAGILVSLSIYITLGSFFSINYLNWNEAIIMVNMTTVNPAIDPITVLWPSNLFT